MGCLNDRVEVPDSMPRILTDIEIKLYDAECSNAWAEINWKTARDYFYRHTDKGYISQDDLNYCIGEA